MLIIKNLCVSIKGHSILKELNLSIKPGEVHAIMGPNGSGKSTLGYVLAGKKDYKITSGTITYNEKNLLELPPEKRSELGLFLGFQYPIEIPGVNNGYFLRMALNSQRKKRGLDEIDAPDFIKKISKIINLLNIDKKFLSREINYGFSGGEKKKNEILQMLLFKPHLSILDEIDSGLDIDSLKILSKGINSLLHKNRSFLLITHYQRILNYIQPNFVHIFFDGHIILSGNKDLALIVEKKGYSNIINNRKKNNN